MAILDMVSYSTFTNLITQAEANARVTGHGKLASSQENATAEPLSSLDTTASVQGDAVPLFSTGPDSSEPGQLPIPIHNFRQIPARTVMLNEYSTGGAALGRQRMDMITAEQPRLAMRKEYQTLCTSVGTPCFM